MTVKGRVRVGVLNVALCLCGVLSGCTHLGLHHAVPSMPPPPDSPPLTVIHIDARNRWTETPIVVAKGDRLVVQATGEILLGDGGRPIDPDGKGWSSFGVGLGGLIGRIDDDKAFSIGARTHLFPDMHPRPPHIPFVPPALRMKRDGKLFLGFKGWKPGKLDGGTFVVTIWRQQP